MQTETSQRTNSERVYLLRPWANGSRSKEKTMVKPRYVTAPAGVAPGRGYSHVVTGKGRLVVISGQVAQDEHGELVGPGDPAAQARQVFQNLGRCLAEAGASFSDVVKLGLFVL